MEILAVQALTGIALRTLSTNEDKDGNWRCKILRPRQRLWLHYPWQWRRRCIRSHLGGALQDGQKASYEVRQDRKTGKNVSIL